MVFILVVHNLKFKAWSVNDIHIKTKNILCSAVINIYTYIYYVLISVCVTGY